jgi:hypothetical protein
MVYLIAGLDRSTFARWHEHVMAADVSIATRIAQARAAAQGLDLVVAAVIGPYSSVVRAAEDPSPSATMAAHPRSPRREAA